MKSNKNFILGGGISGLLYAYYHPEFTIISPNLGGQLNHSFFKNVFYLHETPETTKLIEDLNLKYQKKTQLIKYVKKSQFIKTLTVSEKIEFIQKKLQTKDKPTDLNLSTNDYYISIFVISFDELLKKLKQNINFIEDSVIRITDHKIITTKTRYIYDKIVSTIPAPSFWSIYFENFNQDLNYKPVTFVLTDKLPKYAENKIFDLLYNLDSDIKFTRISKREHLNQENLYLYEFTGNLAKEDVIKELPKDSKIIEYYVEKFGIVYSNKNNIAPKNIIFLGRFATWDHSFKQQNALKIINENFDLLNIWNIQKRFTSNFVDFNTLSQIEIKEKYTKEYILALMPEVTEVLNEVNYKQHKARKKISVETMKYELIDTFKYLLNLFLVWDINPSEFIELFLNKSKIVKNQYNEFRKK